MAEARAIHGITRGGRLWLLSTDGRTGRRVPVEVTWDSVPDYRLPLLLAVLSPEDADLAEEAAGSAGRPLDGYPTLAADAFLVTVAGSSRGLHPWGTFRDPAWLARRLGVVVELDGRGYVCRLTGGVRDDKVREFDATGFAADKRPQVPSAVAGKRLGVSLEDMAVLGFAAEEDDWAGLARGLEALAARWGFVLGPRETAEPTEAEEG